MAVEVIRVGDGIAEQSLTETSRSLLLGSRVVPVETIPPSVMIRGRWHGKLDGNAAGWKDGDRLYRASGFL